MPVVVQTNNHTINATLFRQEVIQWGQEHFRAFPWRTIRTPYRVLLSEVMLHRTQAAQVVPVFERFMQMYPDIPSLARAMKDELQDVLQPLGLRWRIAKIYDMVRELQERFDCEVPHEKEQLLSLPGISEYIASAVRCFAWDLPDMVVDTNTMRITARLFGLEIKDSLRRNRQFTQLMSALLDPEQPRAYNYAMLDLASEICLKRRSPLCYRCPVQQHCVYGTAQRQYNQLATS